MCFLTPFKLADVGEKGVIAVFILMTTSYQGAYSLAAAVLHLDQHSLNYMAGLANVKAADLIANFSF